MGHIIVCDHDCLLGSDQVRSTQSHISQRVRRVLLRKVQRPHCQAVSASASGRERDACDGNGDCDGDCDGDRADSAPEAAEDAGDSEAAGVAGCRRKKRQSEPGGLRVAVVASGLVGCFRFVPRPKLDCTDPDLDPDPDLAAEWEEEEEEEE